MLEQEAQLKDEQEVLTMGGEGGERERVTRPKKDGRKTGRGREIDERGQMPASFSSVTSPCVVFYC
jgi:hypothetical protein